MLKLALVIMILMQHSCDDGSCLTNYGCTDVSPCNYDPNANCDDGSCLTNYGCTDVSGCNYDPNANCDDGSCLTNYGCTDVEWLQL